MRDDLRIDVSMGNIVKIKELLGQGVHPAIQGQALHAVIALSRSSAVDKELIAQVPGLLASQVELLGSHYAQIKKNAAFALGDLAFNNPENQALIGQMPGVMTSLGAMLVSKNARAQARAVSVFNDLTLNSSPNQKLIGQVPGTVRID